MNFLLDVNALVALGLREHGFHQRARSWANGLIQPVLATCATTELGFVRVIAQAPAYGFTVIQARTLLADLKRTGPALSFFADDRDVSTMPAWVQTPKQITDGHLLDLAQAHGAGLATLDRRIPGAYLIPDL